MEAVKQEFSGSVGDVAGRDIINHLHTQGRLLTKPERIALHKLVQRLESEFGEPGWQTWKFLHRTIGVENIDVMCLGHRDQAETILELLLERASLQDALANKTDEFDQSAQAITTLAERNSGLAAQLKQAQQAYAVLKAQAAEPKQVDNCTRCKAATEVIGRTRKHMLLARVAAGAAAIAAASFSYQAHSLSRAAQTVQARFAVCEFEGKPFTVGSIIDNTDAPDIECVASTGGQSPQWKTIKQKTYGRAR